MLDLRLRPFKERLLDPTAARLARRVSANALTGIALAVTLGAAALAAAGQPIAAVAAWLVGRLLDGLDGPVARHRGAASDLGGYLDMVADTVRQRQQFARKIKSLTAMGRMSAYTLIGLPFFLAFAISLLNPGYLHPLLHTSAGHMLIAIGVAMMAVGSGLLQKIVSFKG